MTGGSSPSSVQVTLVPPPSCVQVMEPCALTLSSVSIISSIHTPEATSLLVMVILPWPICGPSQDHHAPTPVAGPPYSHLTTGSISLFHAAQVGQAFRSSTSGWMCSGAALM